MNLYIIGDVSDKDNITAFTSKLQQAAIEPIVLYPTTDFMAKSTAVSCPLAVLWISSKTSDIIFNIAKERNEKNLTTINYFADSVALSDYQKKAVGRNCSVFASLNPDCGVAEVVSLVEVTQLQTLNQTLSVQDKTIETKSVSQGKEEKISVNQNYIKNSKEINSTGDSMNESENSDEQVKIYSPWKALLIIIVVYIVQLLINQWLDFRVDEVYPYIMHIICLYISKACIDGVKHYQIENGKSILSTVVIVIGWISLIGYVSLIIVNLCGWLFD